MDIENERLPPQLTDEPYDWDEDADHATGLRRRSSGKKRAAAAPADGGLGRRSSTGTRAPAALPAGAPLPALDTVELTSACDNFRVLRWLAAHGLHRAVHTLSCARVPWSALPFLADALAALAPSLRSLRVGENGLAAPPELVEVLLPCPDGLHLLADRPFMARVHGKRRGEVDEEGIGSSQGVLMESCRNCASTPQTEACTHPEIISFALSP